MAEQLASAAVEMIVANLRDAAVREVNLFRNFQSDLDHLETTFKSIQSVVQDAEIRQWKDDSVRDWLRKLKDAAYDVENILDEVSTEGLRRNAEFRRGNSISCLSLSYPLRFRCKIAHKMKDVREKLSAIEKQKDAFRLTKSEDNHVGNRYGVTVGRRETTSLVDESEICGREEDKEMIVGKLLDKGLEQDDLSVFVVCGMGGLGKTTIAQLVYNDERIRDNFHLRIWVCVSENFDVNRLVKAMIASVDGCECNISDLDLLQRCLGEKLNGKRFLIVLDDVWNENESAWDELRKILRCGMNGSVLMVTTRIEKIATMMVANNSTHESCHYVWHIEKLSHEDSWSLFKKRAFPTGEMDENLVPIGVAIVEKCGGVPLAIKALGSLMKYKSGQSEWLAIKDSEIWNLPKDEDQILPELRLSYFNLLPGMRQCFAYCCIFPKDHEMEVDELIQLWMANGFIVSSDGQKNLPLIGQSIFKELTWRSFFQDIGTNYEGKVICKMHDLMHDLATSIMGHEAYTLCDNKELEIPEGARHVRSDDLFWIGDYKNICKVLRANSLRSWIVFPFDRKDICSSLSKQQYLRALRTGFCSVRNLDLGCKLKHLRYLVLICNGMKTLPESLSHLCNLQTLKLLESERLFELPKDLKAMKKLCFLEMDDFESLCCTPPELGKLTSLCRLSIFIVGEEALQQIGQLKELNLGGELSIKGLENVRGFDDAKTANLMSKMDLTSLSLYWKPPHRQEDNGSKPPEHFDEVLLGLEPHESIERVSISYYPGSKFPKWLSNSYYKKLTEISVYSCINCEYLPPLGKLPSLTFLRITSVDSVRRLGAEWHGDGKCSFPALKILRIRSMRILEEWNTPDSVECFPCLTELRIYECPKLKSLPALPRLKHLDIEIKSNVALLASIDNLTALESLSLDFSVDALPKDLLQNNKALEILTIRGSIKSVSNMLDNLSGLKTLEFRHCSSLEFLPEGLSCLYSLEKLEFWDCESLATFPVTILERLLSLRFLSFDDCERLELFPGPLKLAKSNLQELQIESLPKLQSFPESFASLKSLRKLDIRDCGPQLGKRCEKPNGEDWQKISHIPTIQVDGTIIQEPDVN